MPVRASSLPVDALLKEGTSESVRGRARAWPRTARVEGALAGGAPSACPRARPGAARREADSGRRPGMYSRRIAVGLRDGFSALETRALSRRERTSCSSPAGARAGREDVVGPAGVALVGSSFPSRALALDVLLNPSGVLFRSS